MKGINIFRVLRILFLLVLLNRTGPATAQVFDKRSLMPEHSLIGKKMFDYALNKIKYLPDSLTGTGKRFNLSKPTKTVVLDFWARQCAPCIATFPKINELQKEFAGEILFILVGINDKYNREMESFYEGVRVALGLKLAVAFDSLLVWKMGITGVPTSVIISPDGTVADIVNTRLLTADRLRILLQAYTEKEN